MARKIRALRHWKQRFDPNAKFIWRKRTEWGDQVFEPGDPIPDEVLEEMGRTKLRRFWESHWVELAEFEDPDATTGRVEDYPDPAADVGDADGQSSAEAPPVGDPGDAPASAETVEPEPVPSGDADASPDGGDVPPAPPDGGDGDPDAPDGDAAPGDGGDEPGDGAEGQAQAEPSELPEGVAVSGGGGGWFTVTRGEEVHKVRGQEALDELLEELRSAAPEAG